MYIYAPFPCQLLDQQVHIFFFDKPNSTKINLELIVRKYVMLHFYNQDMKIKKMIFKETCHIPDTCIPFILVTSAISALLYITFPKKSV